MSAGRTERLVNLVICLLATRTYLTAARIRSTVAGYDARTDEAFGRMFERDKAELRDLGIPLETGTNSVFDSADEVGYRIARRDYELPEIRLEPDEAAVIGVAARLWQSGPASAASSALVKLRAAGVDIDASASRGVEPVVHAGEPAFGPCIDAVQSGRALRFSYRSSRPGAAETRREVEPWGVVSWHGNWYLVGHDRDRAAVRCFRLSRITGTPKQTGADGAVDIPSDVDLRGHVARAFRGREQAPITATLWIRSGAAAGLRRISSSSRPSQGPGGAEGDEIEVTVSELDWLASRVVGAGDDVVARAPEELRNAVVARLRALVEATA